MSDEAAHQRARELLAPDERLVFIRGGHCEHYDSRRDAAPPVGAECDNFRPFKDHYYVYTRARADQPLNLTRLGAEPGAARVRGVTVVQVATRPEGKQVVVGWFRGATAFAEFATRPFPPRRPFCFEASVDRAVLLRPDERTLVVPKGRPGEMGQSQVRYASDAAGRLLLTDWMIDIVREIRRREAARGLATADDPRPGPTPRQRAAIDRFARARAIEHFAALYTTVADVHDHEPFDLLCSNRGDRSALRVAVVGTTGEADSVLVTSAAVDSARAHRTALFIASELTWADAEAAVLRPDGWRRDVIDRWTPADHDLNPTAYAWHNPTFKPGRR